MAKDDNEHEMEIAANISFPIQRVPNHIQLLRWAQPQQEARGLSHCPALNNDRPTFKG